MSLQKFNAIRKINWNVNTDGWNYIKLKELEENKDYPLKGMFISGDNGYGEGAVLISDGMLVNIPQKYVQTLKDIMSDQESIDEINAGGSSFRYHTYISKKYGRPAYEVVFN